jgi:hypothetical protein
MEFSDSKINFHRALLKVQKDWLVLLEKIIMTRDFFARFQSNPQDSILFRIPSQKPSSTYGIFLAYPDDTIDPPTLPIGTFVINPCQ